MPRNSAPSLRQVYELWVEDQIEEYKDSVPRADLLRLADEVCEEVRVNQKGQYQITEVILCDAVDRKIFTLLKLPGYRTWCRARRAGRRAFGTDHGPEDAEDLPAAEVETMPDGSIALTR